MATISPTWRASSRHIASWWGCFMVTATRAARPGGIAPKSGSGFIQRSRSAKVKTWATPGSRLAASVRMAAMRACACGLRTKATWSIPGSLMSSTKRPSPRR